MILYDMIWYDKIWYDIVAIFCTMQSNKIEELDTWIPLVMFRLKITLAPSLEGLQNTICLKFISVAARIWTRGLPGFVQEMKQKWRGSLTPKKTGYTLPSSIYFTCRCQPGQSYQAASQHWRFWFIEIACSGTSELDKKCSWVRPKAKVQAVPDRASEVDGDVAGWSAAVVLRQDWNMPPGRGQNTQMECFGLMPRCVMAY